MRHFWAQNDPFALKKFVSRKYISKILLHLLALFHCAKFQKKSIEQIKEKKSLDWIFI